MSVEQLKSKHKARDELTEEEIKADLENKPNE